MKFRTNEDGIPYLSLSDLMDPYISGVYFDCICEYCRGKKEKYKECKNCGAPSILKHIKMEDSTESGVSGSYGTNSGEFNNE